MTDYANNPLLLTLPSTDEYTIRRASGSSVKPFRAVTATGVYPSSGEQCFGVTVQAVDEVALAMTVKISGFAIIEVQPGVAIDSGDIVEADTQGRARLFSESTVAPVLGSAFSSTAGIGTTQRPEFLAIRLADSGAVAAIAALDGLTQAEADLRYRTKSELIQPQHIEGPLLDNQIPQSITRDTELAQILGGYATTQALQAISLTPGPKGDKGDTGDRTAEFNYYGATVPSSPTDGQTWRETTSGGLFVRDWVWVAALARWVDTFARFSEVPVNIWSASGGVSWINYAWPRPLALGAYRASLIFTSPDSVANHHTVDIRFAELAGSGFAYPQPTLLQPTHSMPRPNGVNQPTIWVSGWQIISSCWHMRGQITPVGTAPAFYGRLFCEQREVRP